MKALAGNHRTALDEVGERTLRALLYLLPLSILAGTNIPTFEVSGRVIYVGTNEILIVTLLCCLFVRLSVKPESLALPITLAVPVALFSAAIVASVVNIVVTRNAIPVSGCIEVLRWFEYLAVFLVVLGLVTSLDQLRKMVGSFVLGAVLNIGVALYQAATFNFSQARIYGLFVSAADRAGESVANPNVAGTIFVFFALYFATSVLCGRGNKIYRDFALLIAAAVAALMTLSRSAMLAGAAGAFCLALLRRSIKVPVLMLVGAVLFALVVGSSDFLSARLYNSFFLSHHTVAAESILQRFATWRQALQLFAAHPLVGVGYGEYMDASGGKAADNYYLEVLASAGIGGFLFLCLMLLWLFWYVAMMRFDTGSWLYRLRLTYLSSLAALSVASVFGGLFINPRILGVVWLLTGLVVRGHQLYWDRATAEPDE